MKKMLSLLTVLMLVSCSRELSETEKEKYITKGVEITQTTFDELSGQLMQQMQQGGPASAIPYCNIQALPLTEKIAETYNVEIQRTSERLRNTLNQPSKRALAFLNSYKKTLNSGTDLLPIVEHGENSEVHFYAPILLADKCVACHGIIGKNVSVKTDSILKSLYPNDEATGYSIGDLRGMWDITFKN